jgi:phosphoketolase
MIITLPDFRNYDVDVNITGTTRVENTNIFGVLLHNVMGRT